MEMWSWDPVRSGRGIQPLHAMPPRLMDKPSWRKVFCSAQGLRSRERKNPTRFPWPGPVRFRSHLSHRKRGLRRQLLHPVLPQPFLRVASALVAGPALIAMAAWASGLRD
jgi:hypothetical protein